MVAQSIQTAQTRQVAKTAAAASAVHVSQMALVLLPQTAPPEATARKASASLHHRVAPTATAVRMDSSARMEIAPIRHHAAPTTPALKAKSVQQTMTHQPAYLKVRVSVVEMNNAPPTNTATFLAQHARQAVVRATVRPDSSATSNMSVSTVTAARLAMHAVITTNALEAPPALTMIPQLDLPVTSYRSEIARRAANRSVI